MDDGAKWIQWPLQYKKEGCGFRGDKSQNYASKPLAFVCLEGNIFLSMKYYQIRLGYFEWWKIVNKACRTGLFLMHQEIRCDRQGLMLLKTFMMCSKWSFFKKKKKQTTKRIL